jgi:hypothetical protein
MDSQTPDGQDQMPLLDEERRQQLERRFRSGVNWFFWIAGLSLVNTILYAAGANLVFLFGLGATQFVDGLVAALANEAGSGAATFRGIGVGINLGIAGLFVIAGLLGRARKRPAIIAGMAVYSLDAILVLVFKDYLSAAFHVWALFGIFNGLKVLRQLEEKSELPAGEVVQSPD